MDLAKFLYETFGIQHPRAFIVGSAIIGFILFGGVAWLLVYGYNQATKNPETKQENSMPNEPKPSIHINQNSAGSTNSPNTAFVANTINVNMDRQITEQIARGMASSLSGIRENVNISCAPGDAEQQNLANQLFHLLSRYQWAARLDIQQLMGQQVEGIELRASEAQMPAARRLEQALEQAGIRAHTAPPDNLTLVPGIHLVIGRR